MAERLLLLTGRLAYESLCRELEALQGIELNYQVRDLGVKVAALMTTDLIRRRLTDIEQVDRIILPGLCLGSVAELEEHFGIPVERGPKDLKDLPEYFGAQGRQVDLSDYTVEIFAEIVDAPELSIDAIVARAQAYRADGADVIDLGCLPQTPFAHLEETIQALHENHFKVSVDSLETDDLLRAGRAGADYLLSLKESTLWIADEVASVPVLIPEDGSQDGDSLYRACETLMERDQRFFADAILEPIHFGFTASIVRYEALRKRLPEVPILMGTGNVTELTDADTSGMNALLFGLISELNINAILTTEVSPHCRTVVREADLARRMMLAAQRDQRLPRGYHNGLMTHHDRKPFPYTAADIAQAATLIKDANFRIQTSAEGLHIYNRDGLHQATDPFALWPRLTVTDDPSHVFYLGVELARAQVAWQLGKRYMQDNELDWGCAGRPDNNPL